MYVCLSILTTAFVFLYSAVETPSNDTFAVGATVAYETETDVDPLGVSSLFVGEDQNGIATFHGGQKRNRAKGREEDKGMTMTKQYVVGSTKVLVLTLTLLLACFACTYRASFSFVAQAR